MKLTDIKKFLTYWLVNSTLLFFINYLLPNYYELGNWRYAPFTAAVIAGLGLTMVGFVAKNLAKEMGINKKGRYQMFAYYGLANSAGIWIIARAADLSGFGIARYYWAVVAGFLASAVQWLIRQLLKKSDFPDSDTKKLSAK